MNNSVISIIIPVYNGERHIANCYNCLCSQSLTNWEAVFVNDGSTDNTEHILSTLGADPRVKVIHKKNEGVAVAREYGIKEATSEFITFLDVDDTLTPEALKYFYAGFNSEEIDIVVGGLNLVDESGQLQKSIKYFPEIISSALATDRLCDGRLRWQLWAKAFRKSVIESTITPNGLRRAEDMAVCIQATVNSRNVRILGDSLYNYIQVTTSVTHSKAKELSFDALHAADLVNDTVGEKISQSSIDCMYLLIVSLALRAGISKKDKEFIRAIDTHTTIAALRRLNPVKAMVLCIFRWLRFNPAKYV